MSDFYDDVVFPILVIGGIFASVMALAVGIVEISSRYQCSSYERITGTVTEYNTLDACYVETATGWQRWDEYKARIIASEGLSQ